MLSFTEQQEVFDGHKQQIDRELRATGFEDVLTEMGLDPDIGLLVVGRSFTYSSVNGTRDESLDPLATRLETMHEVGLQRKFIGGHGWQWLLVSQALHGEAQEPAGLGYLLDYIQMATVTSAVGRLLTAKSTTIPFLTKSLRKIDPAGD